jgi:hypothetical protein
VTARGPNLRAVHLGDAADGSPLWGCDHVGADGYPWTICECALATLDRLGRAAHATQRRHLGDDVTQWGDLTDAERDAWRMAGYAGSRGAVVT